MMEALAGRDEISRQRRITSTPDESRPCRHPTPMASRRLRLRSSLGGRFAYLSTAGDDLVGFASWERSPASHWRVVSRWRRRYSGICDGFGTFDRFISRTFSSLTAGPRSVKLSAIG